MVQRMEVREEMEVGSRARQKKERELSPSRETQSSILSFSKKKKQKDERLFKDCLRGLEEEGTCENQVDAFVVGME